VSVLVPDWLLLAEYDERPADDKLGDELAAELADTVGLSCDALTLRVRRRRAVVLAMLRSDARFVRRGAGRASRWVLAARTAPRARQDGLRRIDSPWSDGRVGSTAGDAQQAITAA
jgi:hypothetical protein